MSTQEEETKAFVRTPTESWVSTTDPAKPLAIFVALLVCLSIVKLNICQTRTPREGLLDLCTSR